MIRGGLFSLMSGLLLWPAIGLAPSAWAHTVPGVESAHNTGIETPAHPVEDRTERAEVSPGSLTACRPLGDGTKYEERPLEKVDPQPLRIFPLLLVKRDGHWGPAAPSRPGVPVDPSTRCDWVFVDTKGEIEGRVKPDSMFWGPMCNAAGCHAMAPKVVYFNPELPAVPFPSCKRQLDRKFVPILEVESQESSSLKLVTREIPLIPDPNWQAKYGFKKSELLKVPVSEGGGDSYGQAVTALRLATDRRRAADDTGKPAPEDELPPIAPPVTGDRLCPECL